LQPVVDDVTSFVVLAMLNLMCQMSTVWILILGYAS